jgi:hypothetical protein
MSAGKIPHLYGPPQDVGFRVRYGPGLSGVSGRIGPGLCRLLNMNFREFFFYDVR